MSVTVHHADVVLPVTGTPLRDAGVAVADGVVVAVGRGLGGDRTRHHRGVLTPGLVNAHAHLEYGPPFAHLATAGLPFPRWIAELNALRRSTTRETWAAASRASVRECLRHGVTAVADVVTEGPGIDAASRAGLRGVSYAELAGVDAARWAAGRERLERLLGQPGRRRGVSPHTLYTLGTAVFRDMVELARSRGLRLHPHLAETADEAEFVMSGTGSLAGLRERFGLDFELHGVGAGVSAVRHCADLGGLGEDVHVAHGIHVDAEDRALLRRHGTAVALCPRSNRTLQSGDPPVADYLAEGNPVAIGTDSLASVETLDVLADARELRDLARAQGYAAADLDRRLVEAATVGGAHALGDPALGRIEPGLPADLAVFDVPVDGDPYAALIEHGPGRCTATVLGGVLVRRAA